MKDLLLAVGTIILWTGFFTAGAYYQAHNIQASCESDDQKTVINGTEYLCLSQRHLEMIMQQQRSKANERRT
jgi:hypothetical protein